MYLRVKYYLIEFKKANIIILKKLKKEDYLKLKLYYLITLLNTLKKVLEVVIIKKLGNFIKKYKLLPL